MLAIAIYLCHRSNGHPQPIAAQWVTLRRGEMGSFCSFLAMEHSGTLGNDLTPRRRARFGGVVGRIGRPFLEGGLHCSLRPRSVVRARARLSIRVNRARFSGQSRTTMPRSGKHPRKTLRKSYRESNFAVTPFARSSRQTRTVGELGYSRAQRARCPLTPASSGTRRCGRAPCRFAPCWSRKRGGRGFQSRCRCRGRRRRGCVRAGRRRRRSRR